MLSNLLSSFTRRFAPTQTVVIILGMHRSGTSCLTGTLEHYGLYLGDVVTEAPHNKKGNRENLTIMALNNKVLEYNGASWDQPPQQTVKWTQDHAFERDQILRAYTQKVWGFKDPRCVFTLAFWLEGLKKHNIKFIASYRNPVSVARSICSRNKEISLDTALGIWTAYNLQLIEWVKQYEIPLISFELASADYDARVRDAMRQQGLAITPASEEGAFFEDNLRNQFLSDEEREAQMQGLPEEVIAVYNTLESLAL